MPRAPRDAQAPPRPPGRAAPSAAPGPPSRVPQAARPSRSRSLQGQARPPRAAPCQGHRGSPGRGPQAGLRSPPILAQFAALHRLLRGTCGERGASGGGRGGTEPPRPRPRAPRYLCGAAWRACWGPVSACTSCGPRPTAPPPSRVPQVPLAGALSRQGRAPPVRHAPALKGERAGSEGDAETAPSARGARGTPAGRVGGTHRSVGGVRGHTRHVCAVQETCLRCGDT